MVLPTLNRTKSYWIEAANSPLRDYRSSTGLPAECDIVIIGSGMAGATAAYWVDKVSYTIFCFYQPQRCHHSSDTPDQYTEKLVKQPRVTLLEAQDICGSATGRNGNVS